MGKYKYGKPNREIEQEQLAKALEKSYLGLQYRAYIILLYWIGCRRSEPLSVKTEDVREKNGSLFIEIPAFKGGQRGGAVELPLGLYGVNYVRELWKATPEGSRLFRFSDKTGYRKVKRLFPRKSPHWFRHNRLTKLRRKRDQGEVSTDDIKSFTGIRSDSTIEHYGMQTRSGVHKVAQALD